MAKIELKVMLFKGSIEGELESYFVPKEKTDVF